MKKTLSELLKEPRFKKSNVKIGSKGGSSFWYCGKANPIYSTIPIRKARESLLKQVHKAKDRAVFRLEHREEIYAETLEKAKKKTIKDMDKYLTKLNRKKELEYINLPKKIKNCEYDIKTTLFDRPVEEVVKGICIEEQPCYIVYVKGSEIGRFWTIEEYNNKDKPKEKKNDN